MEKDSVSLGGQDPGRLIMCASEYMDHRKWTPPPPISLLSSFIRGQSHRGGGADMGGLRGEHYWGA